MRAPIARTLAVGLMVMVAACGGDDNNDTFSPSTATVAGSYSATTFTVTTPAGTLNLLTTGASITVTLATDGTTTGRLFVPHGNDDGSDLDEDLAGTWSLSGSTVTFNQTAGTFLTNVQFSASENQLASEGQFNGSTIQVVLTKSS
jgi:hypothetical protein